MILTKNLECSACGGRQFTRIGSNEYRCQHCDAVTLVEDDVAQRLEKILLGLQQRPPPVAAAADPKAVRIALATAFAVVAVIVALAVFGRTSYGGSQRSPTRSALPLAPSIDPARLKLVSVRETSVGNSRHLVGRFVNDTGQVIRAPGVKVVFYNGANRGSETSAAAQVQRLLPGESAWFDLALPAEAFSRYEIAKAEIGTPYESMNRGKVVASRLQLVRQGERLSLIGGLRNEGGSTASSISVLATLYDREHRMVGIARAYPEANKLAPGESTLFRATCDFVEGSDAASFDYLVESEQKTPAAGPPTTLVTVAAPARRVIDPASDLSLEELLDPSFAFFDGKLLALSTPRPVLSDTKDRLFIAEVSNRSPDKVAIEPRFTITFFDGTRQVARETKKLGRFLYPGEKLPVMFGSNSGFARFTEYKIEWGEFKQSALPGPAARIEASVGNASCRVRQRAGQLQRSLPLQVRCLRGSAGQSRHRRGRPRRGHRGAVRRPGPDHGLRHDDGVEPAGSQRDGAVLARRNAKRPRFRHLPGARPGSPAHRQLKASSDRANAARNRQHDAGDVARAHRRSQEHIGRRQLFRLCRAPHLRIGSELGHLFGR